MSEQMELLLIEDSPADARLLEEHLRDSILSGASVERVGSLASGLDRLSKGKMDAVLLDLNLPDSSGLETFARVARAAPGAAVVVVTGLDDARMAEEAVRLGAQDYLVKDEVTAADIGRAVTYAVRRQRILDDLERARREQLEAKDRFLSHVSHELRSPLAVIHQFVSLLADGTAGPLSADQRDYLDVTARNVDQLRAMIDDLLEVGRLGRDRLTIKSRRVSLGELLRQSVSSFRPAARARSIELTLEAGSLPAVSCDPQRVHQVMTNLLDNALKFTPDGGVVGVEASASDGQVRVSVHDSGRGIQPGNLEKVFEQFFQENDVDEAGRAGLGLGLFVCRQLISRQGGTMWAESVPGSSTTVHFTVPISEPSDLQTETGVPI